MLTIILLALLCVAIIGGVIYFFFLNEKESSDSAVRPADKITNGFVDTRLFREGLHHVHLHHPELRELVQELRKKIIGMDEFIHAIVVNLLCGGHLLVEGVPGLAKTKTIHAFSEVMGMQFKRIQFTPDMLPADIMGTEIYNAANKTFEAKIGPIMTNILLADEINRATPKVQSALLEAMQEHQVSIGGTTYPLPDPFFVLATQNPLEQEGTYPLPEAQIDRFLFKILVNYPSLHDEKKILDEQENDDKLQLQKLFSHENFMTLRTQAEKIEISEPVKHYITKLVHATRQSPLLVYGASPRGSIGMMLASKALAFCEGKNYVTIEDVQKVALVVLRHRVVISYEAKNEGRDADTALLDIFQHVALS